MSISKSSEKIIMYNVKTRINQQIYNDESRERTLRSLNKNRLLEKDNMELKMIALGIAEIYFSDGITFLEFKNKVFKDYPKYEDNYAFNIFLEQGYRKLYCAWLQKQENRNKMLKKLLLVYEKKYKGDE